MKRAGLVGRREGLQAVALLRAERRVRGETDLTRIVGRPGIGKTAFLDEILASAGETIRVRAKPTDEQRPYATLSRLLRAAVGEEGEAPQREAKIHTKSMAHRLSQVLRGRTEAIIAIDDAHWLDDDSRDVLVSGAEQRAFAGLFLAERNGGALSSPWPEVTVRLEPLHSSSAAQLARRVAPRASTALVEEIVRAADGVPFGIVLLARALVSKTRDESDLIAIVSRRLARESRLADTIARLVAGYSDHSPIPALAIASTAELGSVAKALSALSDLIETDGESAHFRHAILRDIVHAYDPTPSITARSISTRNPPPKTIARRVYDGFATRRGAVGNAACSSTRLSH